MTAGTELLSKRSCVVPVIGGPRRMGPLCPTGVRLLNQGTPTPPRALPSTRHVCHPCRAVRADLKGQLFPYIRKTLTLCAL